MTTAVGFSTLLNSTIGIENSTSPPRVCDLDGNQRFMGKRVENKIAIVTGGGAGIGRETALMLASEGAKVVVTDIEEDGGQETVNQITNRGGTAKFLSHNVVLEEDWKRVLNETSAALGSPNILVNNAGILQFNDLATTPVEQWHKLMDVNALGVFLGLKHCGSLMAENGGGAIVNLSSTAALVGVKRQSLYGASKGAVHTMTKDCAVELADRKVRVNCVNPSVIDTGMAELGAKERGMTKEEIGQMYPMGHIGEPIDVAYATLFLASDEAKFITGTELVIDGGYTAK
ncbi:SDR family NAD(P)-dependent oxidoreductase [Phormidium sp. CCY1219]|uniref:SDR family NAD(P)-dependent oxidoreductase n=1 Tax=Phormidium sp. CCY1219 TaxID=2886104 RepID=UPI002D1F94BA|nr:glucose 1-dehydrogenase [Phormidium sp. CCY1219]MEB3829617.1 glucose 1-dehydrogenase [Phormidium sp. CCY1219]